MRDKEQHVPSECDDKAASTMAASSVARYFKENRWKIISFFPNVDCPNRVEKVVRGAKKNARKSKESK